MSDRPNDIRYTSSHEWVRYQGGVATIGITDFAVEHLGDLVFVQLPEVGDEVSAGDSVCEVESVKAVGEIYSPVAGEIVEVNAALGDDQGPLASDPFGAGWLFKIKTDDDASSLMDLATYEAQLDAAS
ncbi:MAG: glycine cleavage system protein GcvH [Planctomycetota bacterium]|nr:glycine cleavage system protein GcvH [Planctomycetota bacterium]MCB9825535.1 glycine cleavage system protein GcvH [Planctomycetota bacterium]MCB9900629.1 glycine cleavage system protein GcvH [Planctomycetota bacterium]